MKRIFLFAFAAGCLSPAPAAVELVVGEPVTGEITQPFSVDFDAKGALYGVEFTKSNQIFKFADGKLQFIAGMQHNSEKKKARPDVRDGDDPTRALFHGMHDIQITLDGRAVIGDSFNNRVRLLDLASGKVSTLAGTGDAGFGGDGGPPLQASFSTTMTATLSPDQNRIYVADIGNHRVRMIDPVKNLVTTVAGNGEKGRPTDGADALQTPFGDARAVTQAKDGTLYVLLRGGHSLVEVKDGKARTVVNAAGKKGYSGDGGPARDATMNGPKYLAMDANQDVLICDTENNCVRRYSPKADKIELVAGKPPQKGTAIGDNWLTTELDHPHGVRIGPGGVLYVADTYNNRVLRGEYR
jgi:DNA-binding beta-propeller fold protein YncE